MFDWGSCVAEPVCVPGTGDECEHFDPGICAATDWPTANTPWLALDRDRSGHIDGGSELFGSATRLRSGSLADCGPTGDGDRRSSGLELQPLAGLGLVAIELGYRSDRRCDARANCEVERASFVWRDGLGREQAGEVIDVHLACQ